MNKRIALSALVVMPFLGTVSSADSIGMIKYEFVNIRINPGMTEAVNFILKKGDKVQILSEKDGWINIKYKNKKGWLQSNAISKVSTDNKSDAKYKKVMSNTLNAREKGSIGSKKMFVLKKNDVVEVMSESNGWSHVKYGNKTAHVSSLYLKDTVVEKGEKLSEKSSNDIDIVDINNADKAATSRQQANGEVKYVDMGVSLDDFVDEELSKSFNTIYDNGFRKVERDELKRYMNPNNNTDKISMMQFARLDRYTEDITPQQLNNFLNKVCPPSNVFYNQGQAFIDAARKYDINVIYLVAHSMIETGNGTSQLANGVSVNDTIVYNFFGIGAVDGNAVKKGAETAYKNGWDTVDKGIEGAAKWISSKYIHNPKYKQNTLYSMKWSKTHIWHQYASDVRWPLHIAKRMGVIAEYSDRLNSMSFEIPRYN